MGIYGDENAPFNAPVRTAKPVAAGLRDVLQDRLGLEGLLIALGVRWAGALSTATGIRYATESHWRSLTVALAREKSLYVPPAWEAGWRSLFWDSLWAARGKWDAARETQQSFKLHVAVRVKGDIPPPPKQAFLPLHQRLRLFRAGKIPKSELLESTGDITAALSNGADLPPEVVQALLEAQQLGANVQSAQAQASAARRRRAGAHDEDAPAEAEAAVEEEARAAAREAAATATVDGGSGGEKSGGGASSAGPAREEEFEARERRGGSSRLVALSKTEVLMYVPGMGARPFPFATVMPGSTSQAGVYEKAGRPMLVGALNGFRTCITCYGQTGSGKTHTLFGPPEVIDGADYEHIERGLACRLLEELFEVAGKRPAQPGRSAGLSARLNVAVAITCVEIYNEQMTDLVTGRRVILRGGANVYLEGAAETPVASYSEACKLLVAAQERKHVAETAMNARSSRAHTVLIVHLEQPGPNGQLLRSSVHLLDLAGSEQLKLSKAEGTRKREAVGINSSLSVLGKVISALVEGAHHVPYYESTLTSLLRGALGGDSLTTMVVTASSDPRHGEQTLSTLGFAQRCQQVVNQARPTAESLHDALAQIDAALAQCEQVLKRQEERGLTHLPAFSKVKEQHTALTARRGRLLAIK
jgi:hypothetical protein